MKKIAVTGGIASGKSTVCQILADSGAYVLSADKIVHKLLSPKSDLGKKVIDLLGSEVVVEGVFDRKKIADKVFSDETLLKKLEKLLHPEVQKVIELEYQKLTTSSNPYTFFVVEIPLLFEAHFDKDYDHIIYVSASETTRKKRFNGSEKEYEKRKKRLLPDGVKEKKSDIIIENEGSVEELKTSLFNKLKDI